VAFLYILCALSIWRLRHHHDLAGRQLLRLESDQNGYFHQRAKEIQRRYRSAPHWLMWTSMALALLAFGIGVCAFFEKEGTQMERIPPDDISRYGMNTNHERMDNGELRFRLMSTDGSGYIRTVAGEKGAWQNSHSHAYVLETYVVQSGWMVLAEFQNGKLVPELLEPGKAVTTRIGIVHNVYLPRGAVIHTVKHGIAQQKDWIPSDDFDKMTKPLSEQELLKIVGRTPGTPPSAPTP